MNLQSLLYSKIAKYDNLIPCDTKIYEYYKRPVVIFSASGAGKLFLDYLRAVKKTEPVAFCDNNPQKQGTLFENVPVYSWADICQNYDFSGITIINPSYVFLGEIERQILAVIPPGSWYLNIADLALVDKDFVAKSKLFECDDRAQAFFAEAADCFIKNCKISDFLIPDSFLNPGFLLENKDRVRAAYDILADEVSRDIYEKHIYSMANIHMTARGYYFIRKSYTSVYDQYFPEDIIGIGDNETFIDAGCYDGLTALDFAKRCNNKYSHIVSFEPEKENFLQAEKLFQKENLKNYYLINKGLYEHDSVLCFRAADGSASAVDISGDTYIEAVNLDKFLKELNIDNTSFIKMDIEGSEIPALLGARETIQKNRPKLAICIYHKPQDLFTIPLLIKEFVPEYKLYIRCHSVLHEMVLYAVL